MKVTVLTDEGEKLEIEDDKLCPWCKQAEGITTCGLFLDCNGRNY